MGAAGGAVLVWSTNAVAAGAALQQLTVAQVLALQFAAATGVLAIARAIEDTKRAPASEDPSPLTARAVAVSVVGLAGTIALQYLAFATAPLVAANAIAYAWPLMVAAWAALAPGRRGSRVSVMLALLGFAGVVMLFFQRGNDSGGGAPLVGYAAALGSALAMAWYTLTAGQLAARRTDLLLVATTIGAAVTVPLALTQSAGWSPGTAVALGIYTGLGPMAAGYALWTHAMSHPTGPRLAPIAYATPLLSTLVLLVSGESLQPIGLIGSGLIVICAVGVLAQRRPTPSASRDSRHA